MYYKCITTNLTWVENVPTYVLTSWVADGQAEVTYKIGEWVTAPEWLADYGYHLMVFDDLEDARQLEDSLHNIFVCEVEDEVPLPEVDFMVDGLSYGEMYPHPSPGWPHGSRMFKRVKLVREVSEDEL